MRRHAFRLEPRKTLSIGRDVTVKVESVGVDRFSSTAWVRLTILAGDGELVYTGLSRDLMRAAQATRQARRNVKAGDGGYFGGHFRRE